MSIGGWWAGPGTEGSLMAALSPASVYSRYEVEDDWCVSVLRSYQAEHGPGFPWSVGKEAWAWGDGQGHPAGL